MTAIPSPPTFQATNIVEFPDLFAGKAGSTDVSVGDSFRGVVVVDRRG